MFSKPIESLQRRFRFDAITPLCLLLAVPGGTAVGQALPEPTACICLHLPALEHVDAPVTQIQCACRQRQHETQCPSLMIFSDFCLMRMPVHRLTFRTGRSWNCRGRVVESGRQQNIPLCSVGFESRVSLSLSLSLSLARSSPDRVASPNVHGQKRDINSNPSLPSPPFRNSIHHPPSTSLGL